MYWPAPAEQERPLLLRFSNRSERGGRAFSRIFLWYVGSLMRRRSPAFRVRLKVSKRTASISSFSSFLKSAFSFSRISVALARSFSPVAIVVLNSSILALCSHNLPTAMADVHITLVVHFIFRKDRRRKVMQSNCRRFRSAYDRGIQT